jgi:hypothetical protein
MLCNRLDGTLASLFSPQHESILLAIALPTNGRNTTKTENLLSFQNIERLEKPHFLSTIANLRVTARLESCRGSTHICHQSFVTM